MSSYDTHRNAVAEPPPLFPDNSNTPTATNSYFDTPSGNFDNSTGNSHERITQENDSSFHNTTMTSTSRGDGGRDFGSASAQFTNDGLAALSGLKDSLPPDINGYWLALWFGSVVLIIGLLVGFHSKIFGLLELLANFIKGLGPLGPPVIMVCLFVTSFPPVVGYSSIVTMSGYVYGFIFGFVIAFSGALVGSVVCFFFCRRWFKSHVRKLMAKNKSLKGVVRTVEKRGFRLLVLIRLAPYPFNIMNALLSATHIPLHTFALATALSLIKLTLHVYIGSTLSSLTGDGDDRGDDGEPKNPDNNNGKKMKIVVMVLSIILGIGVGFYVWMVAKREVETTEGIRIERRRRRRQRGLRRALDSDLSPGGTHGIELSEQSRIPALDLTSRDILSTYDEEEDEHEDQSLFGGLSLGRDRQQRRQGDDWRNVGTNVDSSTESEEDSDFLDDEEDDDDDDQVFNDAELGYDYRDHGEYEEEALDFSAHHAGHVNSPWQEEDEADAVAEESNFLSTGTTNRAVDYLGG